MFLDGFFLLQDLETSEFMDVDGFGVGGTREIGFFFCARFAKKSVNGCGLSKNDSLERKILTVWKRKF
jgi:hypothetical protein